MGVPMVDNCCCCVSLHLGTLIIGYLYTAWALLEIVVYSLMVTLAPIASTHRLVLYATATAVSGVQLLCSALLIVAAYKKLASLTLPWTMVMGVLTAVLFMMSLTGVSLILQDSGEILEIEGIFILVHFTRACISVYCIIVVHSRHKQIMHEEDEIRFRHSGRNYHSVKSDDHAV